MTPFKKNKNEIAWNLINAGLAGALVFLGAIADGNVTINGIALAVISALIVGITKFRDYWITQEGEYCDSKTCKLFNFT